jgi:hypothetical protein
MQNVADQKVKNGDLQSEIQTILGRSAERRKVVAYAAMFSEGDIVLSYLHKTLGISHTAIYDALRGLERLGIGLVVSQPNRQPTVFIWENKDRDQPKLKAIMANDPMFRKLTTEIESCKAQEAIAPVASSKMPELETEVAMPALDNLVAFPKKTIDAQALRSALSALLLSAQHRAVLNYVAEHVTGNVYLIDVHSAIDVSSIAVRTVFKHLETVGVGRNRVEYGVKRSEADRPKNLSQFVWNDWEETLAVFRGELASGTSSSQGEAKAPTQSDTTTDRWDFARVTEIWPDTVSFSLPFTKVDIATITTQGEREFETTVKHPNGVNVRFVCGRKPTQAEIDFINQYFFIKLGKRLERVCENFTLPDGTKVHVSANHKVEYRDIDSALSKIEKL